MGADPGRRSRSHARVTVAKAIASRVGKQRYVQGEPWSGRVDRGDRHPGFLAKMAMCCGRGRYAGIVRPPAWQRYQSAVSLDVTDQQKREASALRRRSVPTGIALARKSSLLECGAEGRG